MVIFNSKLLNYQRVTGGLRFFPDCGKGAKKNIWPICIATEEKKTP